MQLPLNLFSEWNPRANKSLDIKHRKCANKCNELHPGIMYKK